MKLRKYVNLLTAICLFLFAFQPAYLSAQISVVKTLTKELVEYAGKKSAKELAEFGGEATVKQSFEYIVKEGGEKCAERALMYSKIYGLDALKAIKVSPAKIIEAAERTPTKYRRNLFSIVNKQPRYIAERLSKEGGDFLVLEAKYPGWGMKISELGAPVTKTAIYRPKEEVFRLAKNVDGLKAVKEVDKSQFEKFVSEFKQAPRKAVELLERNPKVLFTGVALAAFISAKEEIFGTISKPMQYTLYGLGALAVLFVGYKLLTLSRGKYRELKSPVHKS